MLAVAEAARNVACRGTPLATNRLNFGNPSGPASCGSSPNVRDRGGLARHVPITGVTSALHNETDGKAIHPTPTIGVVGLLEAIALSAADFRNRATPSCCLATVASWRQRVLESDARSGEGSTGTDLDAERALQALLVTLVDDGRCGPVRLSGRGLGADDCRMRV
jgi:phosphoribosylformylglycinamidine synthase